MSNIILMRFLETLSPPGSALEETEAGNFNFFFQGHKFKKRREERKKKEREKEKKERSSNLQAFSSVYILNCNFSM